MTSSPSEMNPSPEVDWKQRCEQLQYEHQLELERIRLHYDQELKEKVTEIRLRLKHEYDQHFAEFRANLIGQQEQSLQNIQVDSNLNEQIHEQIRLAKELDHFEDKQRQQLTDSDLLQRLVNKLHSEGVEVLTLSELLSLRFNRNDSKDKLYEENCYLRSLIGHMNTNENGNVLIKCLAEIFRCEQERRLMDISQQSMSKQLERDIEQMCEYQRNALAKFLSEDRRVLINELEQTKDELKNLKENFQELKRDQSTSINSHHLNKFYLKYLRCEAYRKALIYQKRYLLVLLTGYEDTETYALNEIRRLTNNSSMKSLRKSKSHSRRLINSRFRFRCYATVVIAIIRLRWLVQKWTAKQASIR